MADHNKLGQAGENAAQTYLIQKGYTIRDVNWRTGNMELDIVAETDEYLVVIEVKTRANTYVMHPSDAVNNTRIRRMVAAADVYVNKKCIDKEVRFDIISMIPHGTEFIIEHIEDAFLPPLF